MFQGLFVDGFAGGGGASTGIARALGREVDIAINHDPMAIAVHKANHPTTEHHCQDIRIVWPSAATRHRPVIGAWFSPDCKEHSKAKGGPVKDRNIRQLPWEILPWLKEARPIVGYVENVEEMRQWGPLDENGHVIKELRGKEFDRWVRAIRALGYRVQHRELRACDYGAPTSRKRLYIIMRCDKLPIVWPKRTHAPANDNAVLKGKLLPYRTAAECIDWSIPCRSIFDRERPLKENTERRIAHGVMRYVVNAARPFLVPVTHSGDIRAHDVGDPLRTITTANGGEFAAVDATLAPHITKFHSGSVGSAGDAPMPTVTSNGNPARPAGAAPLGVVGATLYRARNGEREGQAPRALDPEKPLGVVAAESSGFGLAVAAMAPLQNGERRAGETPREQDIAAPLSTIATGGKHALVTAHLEKFNADTRPRPADAPLDTVLAGSARHAAVETVLAPFVDRQFGRSAADSVDDPLATTAVRNKTAQVSAFLSSMYTSNSNGGRGKPDLPLKTICAGANHHAVVAAHIEQANGGPRMRNAAGRSPTVPISTIATTGSQQRIVQTTMIEEGALPPAMMARAVQVAAFLIKYYQSGVPRAADQPFDTITTKARYAVVTVTIDAVTYVIVDIGMRMLTPRELARAQGFPESYILDPITPQLIRGKWVSKPLTKAAQIRMIGNSVCPDVAAALVSANQPRNVEWRLAA